MQQNQSYKFAVAPMIDWTDRHCRYFHRLLTKHALLYTEMIVAEGIVRGDRAKLLKFHPAEHPVALQLGGSDPRILTEAAKIGADFGYDEINLNVGCPSDRVQAGVFGAILMRNPALVADCISQMVAATKIPVTIKCRLGVDEQIPQDTLVGFVEKVAEANCERFIIHARKAWLDGLSPRENRHIPPLDYELVYRLKEVFPQLQIILNGGLQSVEAAYYHQRDLDGVMLGRAAYERPYDLTQVDTLFFNEDALPPSRMEVIDHMTDYISTHVLRAQGRVHHVTRHMMGLFHGIEGARRWRRYLSEQAYRDGVSFAILQEACKALVR